MLVYQRVSSVMTWSFMLSSSVTIMLLVIDRPNVNYHHHGRKYLSINNHDDKHELTKTSNNHPHTYNYAYLHIHHILIKINDNHPIPWTRLGTAFSRCLSQVASEGFSSGTGRVKNRRMNNECHETCFFLGWKPGDSMGLTCITLW